MTISRRSFMAGASALPYALWYKQYGGARTTLTRYDALSPQGQAMLKVYADAVKAMMAGGDQGDPRSWTFQWYTHWVRADKTKASEISRLYPTPRPWKDLAQEMWNTCWAHITNTVEDYFLPWHRMYICYLERIVRQVSGVPTFTLPYWNYSAEAQTIHGVLPTQFRQQSDPAFGSLFVSKRNVADPSCSEPDTCFSDVNAGQPIDKFVAGALDLDALKETSYSSPDPNGPIMGFCRALSLGLHGNVHVLIGDIQNMGSVRWSASDPIFWMHHCNIDRLWASWNRAGHQNNASTPNFKAKQFIFADEKCNRVVATVEDFLDISSLGYTYDRFEPVPKPPRVSPAAIAGGVSAQTRLAIAPSGATALGAERVRVKLEPPTGTPRGAPSLADRVRSLPPERRLYLVLRKLRAEAQPGVLYTLYLELPPSLSLRNAAPYRVGIINFFDAVEQGDQNAPTAGIPMATNFFSFDVTSLAKNLRGKRQLSNQPVLTIVPIGRPVAEAKPVIGEITLVEQ